ncbi:MAG: response regulator [Verrucomicrobiota bacterium]
MSRSSEAPGNEDRLNALATAKSQTNSPPRILVVDDDRLTRKLYTKVLIASGYKVDTAEDGEAGWKLLHAVSYDPDRYNLMVTDNNMPKVSGVELVEKLRSACITLPVIMASATPPISTEGLRLAAILLKPFPTDELVQTVQEVLHYQMPNKSTPNLKGFARRLLACEAVSGKLAAKDFPAFRVCEKLRGPFGKLMGIGSFRSLLSRALELAGAEIPRLRALQIKADGSLEGLSGLAAKLDSRVVAEGEVALVSQLLGLLLTFIGAALTLRLLNEIWPKLSDLNF